MPMRVSSSRSAVAHGTVAALCSRAEPSPQMRKPSVDALTVRTEDGVPGDVHAGPGDRQVTLVRWETLQDFAAQGLAVAPGDMGENVVLRGLAPGALTPGAVLTFEGGAVLHLTGERTPCRELEDIAPGLLRAAVGRCGHFARVVHAGTLRPGTAVSVRAQAHTEGHTEGRRPG